MRKEPSYQVKELGNDMVLDFKEYAQRVISNRRKDINGENVQWNSIHDDFRHRKENPDTIYFKYEFDEEFRAMPLQGKKGKVRLIASSISTH